MRLPTKLEILELLASQGGKVAASHMKADERSYRFEHVTTEVGLDLWYCRELNRADWCRDGGVAGPQVVKSYTPE